MLVLLLVPSPKNEAGASVFGRSEYTNESGPGGPPSDQRERVYEVN